jgi:F-type H+-transporting ATPase subunit delta
MADLITLARPYAKAAFQFAQAQNSLGKWSEMLALLANLTSEAKVQQVLASPNLTVQQQAQALIDVCGDGLNDAGKNLVTILAENKRLKLLVEISNLFEKLKTEAEKTVDVEITTAVALNDTLSNQLAEALKNKLNRTVTITSSVDKNLIGGAIIRAGDTVIDSSVRSRLAKLAEAMHS